MQTYKKNCFFAVRKVVTFDFIKVSFSGYLLAYGTAEAGEMITILSLFRRFLGAGKTMQPWGILGGGYSIIILGWGGAAQSLT